MDRFTLYADSLGEGVAELELCGAVGELIPRVGLR